MVLQKMVQHLQSSFQYDNDKIITEATSTSVQGKYNQTWSKKRLLKVIHSCHRTLSQSRSSERKKKKRNRFGVMTWARKYESYPDCVHS